MGMALDRSTSPTSASADFAPDGPPFPRAKELLAQGGDARLALDPGTGLNKYGCSPSPVTARLDFASSTASIISEPAYAEASALRDRLARSALPPAAAYGRELDQLRADLVRLNGLSGLSGLQIAFAASGTDLHLMVAELVGGEPDRPLLCLAVEAEETGSGVPQALSGRHFSDRAALGAEVAPGEAVGAGSSRFVAVPARDAAGELRPGADIEAELDALVLEASRSGQRVLLTVTDVSKTGLIAPSLTAMAALRRRFPRSLEVLVDACQFRLAPATLRAYLDAGLMVAVTGSKFLTGPTFSGALFVPGRMAERLEGRLLRPGFAQYSARAEWPQGWVAGAGLPEAANFGLLLRWRAAVHELAAFRTIPEARVAGFLSAFADAVESRLAVDPQLDLIDARPLDRRAIGADGGWDAIPTIFPFRLRAAPGGAYLSNERIQAVYRALRDAGVRLGQPVACGAIDGAPVSALRLCASARGVVDAVGEGGIGAEAMIGRALEALDAAADAARA